MAPVFHRRHASLDFGRPATLAVRLRSLAHGMLEWPACVIRHRRLTSIMVRMSEHELKDIGLAPTDIGDATAVGFAEDPGTVLRMRRHERLVGRQRLSAGR